MMVKKRFITQIILGLQLIFFGGMIYLIYRSRSLAMFAIINDDFLSMLSPIKNTVHLPKWMIYSLPDGLWSLSFMFIMDALWIGINGKRKLYFIYGLPMIGLLSEILQLLGLMIGTFDIFDLFCYLIPILLFFSVKHKEYE